MTDPEKLGGFKVLKETALFSPDPFKPDSRLPVTLFRVLAEHEINLSYVTCVSEKEGRWRVDMVVDFKDTHAVHRLLSKTLQQSPEQRSGAAILSIFPHRKKPGITGCLSRSLRARGDPSGSRNPFTFGHFRRRGGGASVAGQQRSFRALCFRRLSNARRLETGPEGKREAL
jgi:hypothetical protein